jgi:hypothetical protein
MADGFIGDIATIRNAIPPLAVSEYDAGRNVFLALSVRMLENPALLAEDRATEIDSTIMALRQLQALAGV